MSSQGEKGLTKMAATAKDDATATLKGDDEKDFGQEANQDKAKAKGDDAKASGKTSGKLQVTQRRTLEKMPMVQLKTMMMQRRTEEKMPMVKLKVTKIKKMFL